MSKPTNTPELDMTDVAVYDAIRPLENNWEHYKREVETLTSALVSEHERHRQQRDRIELAIEKAIRARDNCYTAMKAARSALGGTELP